MSGSIGSAPPIPTYLHIIGNEQSIATKSEAGNAAARLALDHFNTAAPNIKTPQQLLGDYRSLSVVLGAFGLSSIIGQTAVIKALLTQNPTAKTSLAVTSGNALWQRFAKQMSAWTATSTPLSIPAAVKVIAQQYTVNAFETQQGSSTPGMQQALYFTRTIAGASGSLNALMSDPTQLNVVETVLGLDPAQFGALDFTQQQATLKKQVDFKDFASPASIQRYAERYLVMTQLNPPSQAVTYGISSLFQSATPQNSLLGIIGASLSLTA